LIPKSALAAMLIYTGFRLAHPSEFSHMYQVGREQLVIFVTTLVVTLATDLLIGVAAGIGMKFLIHLVNGVPIKSFFKAYLDIEPVSQDTVKIRASESAVFSNWIPFKRQIEHIGLVQRKNLIIDVSDAKLIDHTVMEKLHETQAEMQAEGLKFDIVGLDQHQALSGHAEAARKRGLARLRRITVVAEPACEELLQRECLARGASGFTVTPSRGVGRHNVHDGTWETTTGIRLETIVPFQVSEGLLRYLREEVMNKYHPTVSVETIEVLLPDQFLQADTTESALVHHG
jgi:MFS superfamily sulfate permease-like transporter